MYLYHYSKNKYLKLLTKRRQGVLTIEQIKDDEEASAFREDVGAYCDHISMFFDPIPIDIIGDLFNNKHHTWVNGNKLYEYVIDTKYLEHRIGYRIVESPLLYNMLNKTGWKEDDQWKKIFFRNLNKLQKNIGELGRSRTELDNQCKKFQGKTRESYISLSKRNDFENYRTMYAAHVAHVMIYPSSGIVNYDSVKEVIIGKKLSIENILDKW